MTEVLAITEEDKLELEWYKEARQMDLERLPAFINGLMDNYSHDYGTVCKALAAGMIGAAWAMNKHKNGGITGFQSGAVAWEFWSQWIDCGEKKPRRMLDYSNLLFPQYEYHFNKTISKETWKWLKDEAKKKLEGSRPSDEVYEHWHSIVAGNVPFGFTVGDD